MGIRRYSRLGIRTRDVGLGMRLCDEEGKSKNWVRSIYMNDAEKLLH